MKRLHIILVSTLVAASAMLSSCKIDESFDMSNVESDGIVIGDEITMPVGTVEITIDELLGELDIPSILPMSTTRAPKSYDIAEEFLYDCEFDGSVITDDIVEKLTENGELKIVATFVNPTDLAFDAELNFTEKDGTKFSPFGEKLKLIPQGENSVTFELSELTLQLIANATNLHLECERKCAATMELDPETTIELKLQVIKTGGIKLN